MLIREATITMCNDKRACFARRNGECSILLPITNKDYAYKNDGECPFCKANINDKIEDNV